MIAKIPKYKRSALKERATRKNWSEVQTDEMLKKYESGLSLDVMAKEYDISPSILRSALKDRGKNVNAT